MKKHIVLACLLCAILFSMSCRRNVLRGSGAKGTTTPAVGPFTAIDMDLSLKADITVRQGAQPSVQVSGYENVIRHIHFSTDSNTLHLTTDLDETWTIDGHDVKLTIVVPSLTELSLTGSSDADIHGNIAGSSFSLSNSGASKVIIDNVSTDTFSADVSGACDLTVNGGKVKKADYSISGAGTIKAFPLQSDETDATISGAGKTEVTALQKLTANVNGAGTIKYKGHPAVTKEVSGIGSISDAN